MLHYTDELRAGSANETLSYRPASNGKLINDPEAATISIYDPMGKICLIENANLTFNAQSAMLDYNFSTTDEQAWQMAINYRADIQFTKDGRNYFRVFYFDIVKDPWSNNLTATDLQSLAPAILLADNFEEICGQLIAESEEQLRLTIRSKGISPGMVRNKAALDRSHKLLALSYIYLRASSNGDTVLWAKHLEYQKQHEQVMREMLSKLEADLNQDNVIDNANTNLLDVRLMP